LSEIRKRGNVKNEIEEYLPMLPEYYLDAFRLLFAYENKMRIFVYAVLRGSLGKAWKSIALNQGPSLKSRIETRQNQLRQYGHIGSVSEIPMDYLTMDELVGIVTDVATKEYFFPHFPGSIDKVFAPKFWEILITRNHLMHFRQIQPKDADRLYENILETIRVFDSSIEEFTGLYWPEDLFETDSDATKPALGENWLPVLMKTRAIRIKVVETPSTKWTKIFLLFPYVMRKEPENSGEIYIESFRVLFSSIIGLLKDAVSIAVYYNKFDIEYENIEADDASGSGERMRGLEICFLKSTFEREEALLKSSLIHMLDDVEEYYLDLVERKGTVDLERAGKYFIKQGGLMPIYLGNLQHVIRKELNEKISPEDWTAILKGHAFECIYRKDERYSRGIPT